MDIQPSTQDAKPISDDQELAKALAGVSQSTNDLSFEETPAPTTTTAVADDTAASTDAPVAAPAVEPSEPVVDAPTYTMPTPQVTSTVENAGDLESIKKDALVELRPLVDKLELAPEEQFDTYLLLLRSTDDKSLIAPAHEAAKKIGDETRRAQALLDIIKEIDYFSQPQQN